MSVSNFLRTFKEDTTKTPMQYLQAIRINNAVRLLESTDYNVTEISTIIGNDDIHNFSWIFKKQIDISPSDYMKTLPNQN